MSAVQKDVPASAVLLMMGVAIGIPIAIVIGMIIHQSGWALMLGPPAGLVLGFGLMVLCRGGTEPASS
ncbi:MAG: hypothetical protein HRU14_14135 [Planctomycetes bacterium]|nr:hypothetical protein [Planctomycetota bacterium]